MNKADPASVIIPLILAGLFHLFLLAGAQLLPQSSAEPTTPVSITLADPSAAVPEPEPPQPPVPAPKEPEAPVLSEREKVFDTPRANLPDQDTSLPIAENSAPVQTEPEPIPADTAPLTKGEPDTPALESTPPILPPVDNSDRATASKTKPKPSEIEATSEQIALLSPETDVENEQEELPPDPTKFVPESISPTLRNNKPEPTEHAGISYTLSNYGWSFEYFAKQWAASLQKWWRLPNDYGAGKVPEGGSVWVSVQLAKSGELLDYKVYQSGVTTEMEKQVIQALVSSFQRPPLPDDFPDQTLTVNWRFIYLPINAFYQPDTK